MITVSSVELVVCVPFIPMPTITDVTFLFVSLEGINSLSCINMQKENLCIGLPSFLEPLESDSKGGTITVIDLVDMMCLECVANSTLKIFPLLSRYSCSEALPVVSWWVKFAVRVITNTVELSVGTSTISSVNILCVKKAL